MKVARDNISIVLVGVRTPGNIGSTARAMKNMGVSDLVLVNPAPYDTPETRKLARGAGDILKRARFFPLLEEAIAGCGFVAGTTRRRDRKGIPVVEIDEAVGRIAAAAVRNRVAIVFGREDKGLSNDELALCQVVFTIPASLRMASLNVAQAVMVVCYELFCRFSAPASPAAGVVVTPPPRARRIGSAPVVSGRGGGVIPTPEFVRQDELIGTYRRLERALGELGYGVKGDRNVLQAVMIALRRIFNRSGITGRELVALQGICSQIERHAASKASPGDPPAP